MSGEQNKAGGPGGGWGALPEMSPTLRFTDRVAEYVACRPSYAAGAVALVVSSLPVSCGVIADVGAGTGIFARQLADELLKRGGGGGGGSDGGASVGGARGAARGGGGGVARGRVIAVEPNSAMRAEIVPHGLIDARDGTAEATRLAARSVGAVVAAQAFHWFRPSEAIAEFARVLVPGGRAWLVWNDLDESDALAADYRRAMLEASEDHPAANGFARNKHYEHLRDSALFSGLEQREFANQQRFDAEGLLGRARSASYCPKGGPRWARLERELRELASRHAEGDGHVTLRLVTRVYGAQLA